MWVKEREIKDGSEIFYLSNWDNFMEPVTSMRKTERKICLWEKLFWLLSSRCLLDISDETGSRQLKLKAGSQ